MAIELKVPEVGESITDVVIGEWLKAAGDRVERDEILAVIETDKVNVELRAPKDGVITEILKEAGDDATVDEVIGTMEAGEGADGADAEDTDGTEKAAADAGADADGDADTGDTSDDAGDEASGEEDAADHADDGDETDEADVKPAAREREIRVTPAAKRLLAEAGVDASEVPASGPGDRLLKEDVKRFLEARETDAEPKASASSKTKKEPAAKPAAPRSAPKDAAAKGARAEEVVPMTTLRRRIAERLVAAQQTAAILTTFNEVDMSRVMALRKQYQERFVARYGIKLGFMSFFVKAVIEALKDMPRVNAEIRDDDIVYRNYFDIGVAVGGGKGLVVPVIRNAEQLSFAEVEQSIADLASRARDNKLTLDELQGGTFTISNGGIYGSLLSTPILNPPQSGILGMHKIEERPVAIDGEVVVRPMMYLALSYDHRIVDGREAVTFLVRVKENIEDPTRLLLEV